MTDFPTADDLAVLEAWLELQQREVGAFIAAVVDPNDSDVAMFIDHRRRLVGALSRALTRLRADAPRTGTCETCRFAGAAQTGDGLITGIRNCGLLAGVGGNNGHVPLTVLGRPFGCAGHQAKEAK